MSDRQASALSGHQLYSPARIAEVLRSLGRNTMKVAFIGIGNMGKPMASNIAKRDHEVFLFDANPASAASVARETGASVLGSLAEVSVAEVIVTMLPDGKVVRDVALGENGIAAAAK